MCGVPKGLPRLRLSGSPPVLSGGHRAWDWPGGACRASVGSTCQERTVGPVSPSPEAHTPPRPLSRGGGARRRCEEGKGQGLHLRGVCVQGLPGQALRPKDTLEPSLQLPEQVLPLGAQQEPGAARVPQAQHVGADAAQQALQELLRGPARGPGSAELRKRAG